jgi:hypothetical protein
MLLIFLKPASTVTKGYAASGVIPVDLKYEYRTIAGKYKFTSAI